MGSTRTGMAVPPCVWLVYGSITSQFYLEHRLGHRRNLSDMLRAAHRGPGTHAYPVLRFGDRANSPGLAQSLGRPALAANGAAASGKPLRILCSARGAILSNQGTRARARAKSRGA